MQKRLLRRLADHVSFPLAYSSNRQHGSFALNALVKMQFVNSISKLIQFGLLHSSVPRLLLLLLKAWRPFSCECNIAPAVGGPHNLDVRFGPRHKCLHGGGRSLLRSPRWVLRLTPLDNFLAFSDQRKERDGIVNSRKYL